MTGTGPGLSREYVDGSVRLAVDLPGDETVRVRVADDAVGATFALSIVGAQRLASMLRSAIATAITGGLRRPADPRTNPSTDLPSSHPSQIRHTPSRLSTPPRKDQP